MNINKKKSARNVKQPQVVKKTLDIQHLQQVERLQRQRQACAELEHRLTQLDTRIRELEGSALNEDDVDLLIRLKDERASVQEDTRRLAAHGDVAYYTSTADILYRYYDLMDNNRTPDSNTATQPQQQQPTTAARNSGQQQPHPSVKPHILRFLAPQQQISTTPPPSATIDTTSKRGGGAAAGSEEGPDGNIRGTLLDRYMECVDDNYIKAVDEPDAEHNVCGHCGSDDVTLMINDGYIVCNKCMSVEHIIVDHDKPSYKDPPKEISYFAYKRINHFNEWLNQIQGKETTDIPDEVYDKIILEIKKQRINNMADITYDRIKDILKKLDMNKYYEHTFHIMHRLSGQQMPHLSAELEEKLRSMFKQIQAPFLKHAPPDRKNFLSYSYVLHKFAQLLDKDELLPLFGLLKARDKLSQQDAIWKKICGDLGWQYIPSL